MFLFCNIYLIVWKLHSKFYITSVDGSERQQQYLKRRQFQKAPHEALNIQCITHESCIFMRLAGCPSSSFSLSMGGVHIHHVEPTNLNKELKLRSPHCSPDIYDVKVNRHDSGLNESLE